MSPDHHNIVGRAQGPCSFCMQILYRRKAACKMGLHKNKRAKFSNRFLEHWHKKIEFKTMKVMYINYVYFILYLSKWCYNCTCVLLYAKSSVEYFSPSLLSYRQRGGGTHFVSDHSINDVTMCPFSHILTAVH